MKKRSLFIKAIASLFVLIFCCSAFFTPATAEPVVHDFPATSGASTIYLYNYESNQVLLRQSSGEQIAPASTVKMMTGLLAIRYLENRLEESVTITAEMLLDVQGYTLKLKKDSTVRVLDLLYGVICGGGNDAAHALAILCCGSVDAFVVEMNQLAKEYSLRNTQYKNPTGIDAIGMYTTLDDTVLLAQKAIENPLFLEISSASSHSYTPQGADTPTIFYNRNALISSFSGIGYQSKYAQGLNAGMTDRGGYCVITYATDGHESYLCIVMGAVEATEGIMSYVIANRLIHHVIRNYSYMSIAEKGTKICTIPIELSIPQSGKKETLASCILAENLYGYLPADIDPSKDLTYRPYLHHESLTAPVRAGTVVGGVDVYYRDTKITGGKLIVTDPVPSSALLKALASMKQVFLNRITILSTLCFVLFLSVFLWVLHWRKAHKKINQIEYSGKR